MIVRQSQVTRLYLLLIWINRNRSVYGVTLLCHRRIIKAAISLILANHPIRRASSAMAEYQATSFVYRAS